MQNCIILFIKTSRDHSPPLSKTDNLSSSANSSLAMLDNQVS